MEVVGWIWKRPAAAAAAAHDAAERGAATGPPGRLPPDRRKSLARSCVAIIPTNNKPANNGSEPSLSIPYVTATRHRSRMDLRHRFTFVWVTLSVS